jgi:O-antigen ligase
MVLESIINVDKTSSSNGRSIKISMTRYTSFAVFIFSAIALIVPSGFSFGAALLLIGSVTLLKTGNSAHLNKEDRMVVAVLLFYFLVFVALNLLHGEGIKEYDLPLRFLYAVPALLLLRAYPPAPAFYWAGLIVGGILAGCFAGWQVLFLGAERAGGYTNQIQYGDISFIIGILCLAGFGWAAEQRKATQWIYSLVAGAVFGILGALLTGSRGSWIGLPVCLCVLFYCANKFSKKYLSGAICLLAVCFGIIYFTPGTGFKARAEAAGKEAQEYLHEKNAVTSIGVRMEMWRTALLVIPERPWLGWGKTGFVAHESALIKEGKVDPFMKDNNHVYNEWLDAMVKRGLPGLIALLALYFVPLAFFVRYLRQGNAMQRPYALGGILLIVCYISFGFSQVFMAHNMGVMTLGFMLVILWGLLRGAHSGAQT